MYVIECDRAQSSTGRVQPGLRIPLVAIRTCVQGIDGTQCEEGGRARESGTGEDWQLKVRDYLLSGETRRERSAALTRTQAGIRAPCA